MIPWRHSLLLLMFALASLAAEQTDTVGTVIIPLAVSQLPLWISPEGLTTIPAPDTLALDIQLPTTSRSRWVRGQRWLGLGMTLFFSAVSYHYQREADATYQAYRTSGDIGELDALFRETQRLDRLAAWGYLGAEVGLALVTFSFIFGP